MTSLTTRTQPTASVPARGGAVDSIAVRISAGGEEATRWALVAVIGWIGAMKFTGYEAEAISGFVANSPLLSWTYGVVSIRTFSAGLGVVELLIAIALAIGAFVPRVAIVAAASAAGMFATTLSFLLTTPGAFEADLGGFPALSVVPGQFLVKDLVLLGGSIWLLGRALEKKAAASRFASPGGHSNS